MLQTVAISQEDILHQVKLSCQTPSLIQAIVNRKIIAAAASEAGITIETEELQKAADQFRILNKLQSSEATWAWLQKYILTVDDFEELVHMSFLANKLAQHLFANKVEPYFYEHQLDYTGVGMYEVILDNEDLAMELFYALVEGEISFSEVAHQYTQDRELRRCGGYRGTIGRKELKPEISAAVFASNPPQVLKPITTSKGIHLILVDEIIKPQLDDKLRVQIVASLFNKWLQEQAKKVQASINLDEKTQVTEVANLMLPA